MQTEHRTQHQAYVRVSHAAHSAQQATDSTERESIPSANPGIVVASTPTRLRKVRECTAAQYSIAYAVIRPNTQWWLDAIRWEPWAQGCTDVSYIHPTTPRRHHGNPIQGPSLETPCVASHPGGIHNMLCEFIGEAQCAPVPDAVPLPLPHTHTHTHTSVAASNDFVVPCVS